MIEDSGEKLEKVITNKINDIAKFKVTNNEKMKIQTAKQWIL